MPVCLYAKGMNRRMTMVGRKPLASRHVRQKEAPMDTERLAQFQALVALEPHDTMVRFGLSLPGTILRSAATEQAGLSQEESDAYPK